ncbi:MAG: FAD-dependent oxidoreductase [Polyangiaceae bacterium]|nr:FAD-dependent oxidoreductase [Polyangiaceae bacterium]
MRSGDVEIAEAPRRTPVIARAQVVVLGGGPAGIAAALGAARAGASTVLIERYGFLGGTATAAMVTNFCGLYANVHGEIRRVVRGVADELLERLDRLGALRAPHSVFGRTKAIAFDGAAYKCVTDALLVEAKVDLHLHALAVGAVCEGGRVRALLVETATGRGAIVGETFVDCSGDADLSLWAGCAYEKGDAAGHFPYATLLFRLGGVDDARALAEGKPALRSLVESPEAERSLGFPCRAAYLNPQPHPGEWRVNATRPARTNGSAPDGTNHDDVRAAEIEGRRQVLRLAAFLREYVPGFEASYLLEIAPQLGWRETRRVVAHYRLSGDDVLGCRDFDDAIGVNGWPVEQHQRDGVEWRWPPGRGYHQIPFRCLLPRGIDNLLAAGRCAGATSEGLASLRVSGPCFAMGQAAGTAAALSAASGLAPAALDVAALQARLRAAGVFLGDPHGLEPPAEGLAS